MAAGIAAAAGRLGALALILTLAAWAQLAGPGATDPQPRLSVQPAAALSGNTVTVHAADFPPHVYDLQIAVCGNLALDGTADCDQTAAEQAFSGDGTFDARIFVTIPPKPCPCVIMAFASSVPEVARVPFTVIDAPFASPVAVPPPYEQHTLVVTHVTVGGRSWQSWFGVATTRQLTFTVRNTGAGPVDNPPLVLTVGKGTNPQRVIASPHVGVIAPGSARTLKTQVPFDALSFGGYTIRGALGYTVAQDTFRAHTSIYPWGLIAVAVIVLQLLLLGLRNLLRRHFAARDSRQRSALPSGAPEPEWSGAAFVPPAPALLAPEPITEPVPVAAADSAASAATVQMWLGPAPPAEGPPVHWRPPGVHWHDPNGDVPRRSGEGGNGASNAEQEPPGSPDTNGDPRRRVT